MTCINTSKEGWQRKLDDGGAVTGVLRFCVTYVVWNVFSSPQTANFYCNFSKLCSSSAATHFESLSSHRRNALLTRSWVTDTGWSEIWTWVESAPSKTFFSFYNKNNYNECISRAPDPSVSNLPEAQNAWEQEQGRRCKMWELGALIKVSTFSFARCYRTSLHLWAGALS